MNPINYIVQHAPPLFFAIAAFQGVIAVFCRDRETSRHSLVMAQMAVVMAWFCILSMQIDALSKQRTIEVQVERLLPTAPQQSSEAERVAQWASTFPASKD